MEFEHACSFCGWHRAAASPTMLRPICGNCGCVLEPRRALARPETHESRPAPVLPRRAAVALVCLGAAPVVAFAATVARDAAGDAAGALAFFVTALALYTFLAPAAGRR